MTVTADARTELDRPRFFIDGEWVEPRGTETHRALEAATGETLGTAALGTDADRLVRRRRPGGGPAAGRARHRARRP